MAAFARDWKAARQREQKTAGRGVFVPLAFLPGEAFQFDWSEDWAIIAGERTNCRSLTSKLSYSRAFILRAYPQQTHEMLFDAHNYAFRVFGGVPGGPGTGKTHLATAIGVKAIAHPSQARPVLLYSRTRQRS